VQPFTGQPRFAHVNGNARPAAEEVRAHWARREDAGGRQAGLLTSCTHMHCFKENHKWW
jgi:hypothetical protein